MARPRQTKSKKGQLIVGIGAILLALAMGIPRFLAAEDTAGAFDEEAPDDSALFGAADAFAMDPEGLDAGAAEAGAGSVLKIVADLLAQHGSAPAATSIPDAFWKPPLEPAAPKPEPRIDPKPTPELPDSEGEAPAPTSASPPPKPPPPHLVSLIYVTEDVRRAVVDGVVLGVGDPLGIGRVKTIHRGGIIVEGPAGRVLVLYALGSADPLVPNAAGGGFPWPVAAHTTAPSDD